MKRFRCFLVAAGLALLVGCQSGAPPDPPPTNGPAVIPETTKVADAATRDALVSFDPVTGILIFAAETPVLNSLAVGDVFASDVIGDKAASGFLRKVTAKRSENGRVVLETRPALLEEAVQTGRLVIEQSLRPEDEVTLLVEGVEVRDLEPSELSTQASKTFAKEFDFDNSVLEFKSANGSTVKVAFDGSVKLGATVAGDVDIGFFDINSFYAQVTVFEEAKLKVSAEASLTGTTRYDFSTITLGTATFYIGPVPVVIDVNLIISIGADGKVAARVVTEATQTLSATVGVKYDEDDGWSPINKFDNSFDFSVEAEAEFEARAYVGARVGLYLYGVVGAGFETKAFVRTIVKIPNDPFWVLEGGVDLSAYFEGDFPYIGLQRYEKKLGEFKKEIGRSENTPPEVRILQTSPKPYQNVEINLLAQVEDKEGNCCKRVVWTSDVDGVLSDGTSTSLPVTFSTVGQRVVTVTVTDQRDQSSSANVTLNVVNPAPLLSLGYYQERAKATQPHTFNLRVTDENEEIGCSRVMWELPAGATRQMSNPCRAQITFGVAGANRVRLTVVDSGGERATLEASVSVAAAPENIITIDSFKVVATNVRNETETVGENGVIQYDSSVTVSASASDQRGRPLTYEYYFEFDADSAFAGQRFVLGSGSSATFNFKSLTPSLGATHTQGGTIGVKVSDNSGNPNNGNATEFHVIVIYPLP